MGKKSNRKKHRQQQRPVPTLQPTPAMAPSTPLTATEVMPATPVAPVSRGPAAFSSEAYVRQDIRRIVILLSVMVVIIAALVIIDQKTSWLDQAGDQFVNLLRR